MKNKIDDLRNHLFETIEALKDEEKPMDLDRAKTIAKVGQVIIDSAKAETDFLNKVGGTPNTDFMKNPLRGPIGNQPGIGSESGAR